jgi:D-amino-acid oxidase
MTRTTLEPPDLSDDRIMRVVCGLRPCRRGGLRIEAETLGKKTIVHNYGQGGCGVTIGFGCAAVVREIVRTVADTDEPVGVLGGGVTGMTAARALLAGGYRVRVYADRWAGQTTSDIAGGLWLPTGIEPGETAEQQERFERILHLSHEAYGTLDRVRYGVESLPVYEPSYAPHCSEYFVGGVIDEPVEMERLAIAGPARGGRGFRTDFVHTPRFLRTLLEDIRNAGAETVTTSFQDLDAIRSLPERVLVNCLALGSRVLFGDERVYPAYGVLVHAQPADLGYVIHDGYKYMFPREDALIMGGCFIEDRWDLEPDEVIGREILAHHRRFFAGE